MPAGHRHQVLSLQLDAGGLRGDHRGRQGARILRVAAQDLVVGVGDVDVRAHHVRIRRLRDAGDQDALALGHDDRHRARRAGLAAQHIGEGDRHLVLPWRQAVAVDRFDLRLACGTLNTPAPRLRVESQHAAPGAAGVEYPVAHLGVAQRVGTDEQTKRLDRLVAAQDMHLAVVHVQAEIHVRAGPQRVAQLQLMDAGVTRAAGEATFLGQVDVLRLAQRDEPRSELVARKVAFRREVVDAERPGAELRYAGIRCPGHRDPPFRVRQDPASSSS